MRGSHVLANVRAVVAAGNLAHIVKFALAPKPNARVANIMGTKTKTLSIWCIQEKQELIVENKS